MAEKEKNPQELKTYAWECVQGEHEGPAEGIRILESLVEKDAEACAMLGTCYQNAYGVKQDLHKAAELLEKATDKSADPFYERTLASIYICELDGELLDIEKCVEHAKAAAKRGDQEALSLYVYARTVDELIKRGELTIKDSPEKISAAVQESMAKKNVDLELESILPRDGSPRYQNGDTSNEAKMMALFRIMTMMIDEGKSVKEIMEKTWLPENVILSVLNNEEK